MSVSQTAVIVAIAFCTMAAASVGILAAATYGLIDVAWLSSLYRWGGGITAVVSGVAALVLYRTAVQNHNEHH